MTDLALAFDPINQSGDLCIVNGDLELDRGLGSLALMSLLTDSRALPSELDTPTEDLRGWWGDALEGRALGGKLWTLARAKATEENRRRARDFAAGALDWMVQDGIAERLEVEATRIDGVGSGATLQIDAAIIRGGRRIDLRYDLLWRAMQ